MNLITIAMLIFLASQVSKELLIAGLVNLVLGLAICSALEFQRVRNAKKEWFFGGH